MSLREIRLSKGYKSSFVAEYLNISISAFSKKESGKSKFTIREFCMLCDFYNVDYHDVAEAK